jgi:hypothetical protein
MKPSEADRTPSNLKTFWKFAWKQEAGNTRQARMFSASLYYSHLFSAASSETKMRNSMEEVVGSIPTRSTKPPHISTVQSPYSSVFLDLCHRFTATYVTVSQAL